MALGGGTFTTQNKVLPGTYVNFITASAVTSPLADRGVAAIGLELDWGQENKVFLLENNQVIEDSVNILGYDYTASELKRIREIFLHATKAYIFNLRSGGVKASCDFATAKHPGIRGNDLKIKIEKSEDYAASNKVYNFYTYLDSNLIDVQYNILNTSELKDTAFIDWVDDLVEADENGIQPTAGVNLEGGTNGTVTNAAHQTFLNQLESYSFNALGLLSSDSTLKDLYMRYTIRMRSEIGKLFQVVLFDKLADSEGVVSLKNGLEGATSSTDLIPWVTGVIAGTAFNASATNLKYDGEYIPYTEYTQSQLVDFLEAGCFVLHRVGDEVRVCKDINTFTSVTERKGQDFKLNQVIRITDQIATSSAAVFNTNFLGKVPNDDAGRASIKNALVDIRLKMQDLRAIENFTAADLEVRQGETKESVYVAETIQIVPAAEKLYLVTYLS